MSMLYLADFITEEKNLHMTHVEELIFDEGVNGTRKAINFLLDLKNMLSGNTKNKVSRTVKYDGAPAVYVGIDPTDGEFFVAKKGIFNKNPKVYKTVADITSDIGSGDLQVKLIAALKEFSKLGIKSGVYQGDLMFINGDLKRETINQEEYITFQPNTIVYAVPVNSALAKSILSAKIGVVWHTTYEGDSFENMSASYGKDIVSKMDHVSSVWQTDANYHDVSGVATFTKEETAHINEIMSHIGRTFRQTPGAYLDMFKHNEKIKLLIKTFVNSKIKQNQEPNNSSVLSREFIHYVLDKYNREIEAKKKPETKVQLTAERQSISNEIMKHGPQALTNVFELMVSLAQAKKIIIDKMSQISKMDTFLRTSNGFSVTKDEGYCVIDHLGSSAVKLVDRMEFSRANFSPEVIKGWAK